MARPPWSHWCYEQTSRVRLLHEQVTSCTSFYLTDPCCQLHKQVCEPKPTAASALLWEHPWAPWGTLRGVANDSSQWEDSVCPMSLFLKSAQVCAERRKQVSCTPQLHLVTGALKQLLSRLSQRQTHCSVKWLQWGCFIQALPHLVTVVRIFRTYSPSNFQIHNLVGNAGCTLDSQTDSSCNFLYPFHQQFFFSTSQPLSPPPANI